MNNFSVIIPSKTFASLEVCIDAIRNANETCKIIVVDDGVKWPSPGITDWLDEHNTELCIGDTPFVFSRNINIGIRAAGQDDVILLNDDAILQTAEGFTLLQNEAEEHQEYGVIAAATNNVGNSNQKYQGLGLREDPRMVCFICVLIPRRTINKIGLLNENFKGYGFEDDNYCLRIRNAGLKIGIYDFCMVDHYTLPSTFRSNGGNKEKYLENMEIFKQIHGMDNFGRPIK